MKCIQTVEELEGKKIIKASSHNFDEKIILVFDDETCCILSTSEYSEDVSFDTESHIGFLDQVKYGLMTEQKRDALFKAEEARNNAAMKRREEAELSREKAEYERLKAKFE